ncbi:MAG: carboxylating nicotinate-nucleotide diphosphorylase [Gammaproteobacteria bacterium]|nr:carboxylating nicotinate-nucleotide diphosphorylase [Gammaproteobacteria bacterium]
MQLTERTRQSIGPTVAQALAEDVGDGDLTAALIDADAVTGATIFTREPVIVAGQSWVDEVFAQLDERIIIDWYVGDGQSADPDDVICKLVGPARALLTGERTALNFLQTLSGVATVTAAFVKAIAGTGATILDTRKTLPGLRLAQKYAVTCGGGKNHRIGLFDAVLIKENHIKSAGDIATALQKAGAFGDEILVEIEVEDHDGLIAALDAGAQRILLDNFSLDELRRAVETNASYGYVAAELEASGNITLETARAVAETGVTYLSTGALTKNVRAVDLSMLFRID